MEIRKTWTRSICFSIENHVLIVNVLRWLRGVGIWKSLGKGMVIVGMLFFCFFFLFSYDACVQWFPEGTGIVLGFFKQRQAKENKSSVVIFFLFLWANAQHVLRFSL